MSATLAELFATGTSAFFWFDPATLKAGEGGKVKPDRVHRVAGAPTDADWAKHTAGERVLGIVPAMDDGLTTWAVGDIDEYEGGPVLGYLARAEALWAKAKGQRHPDRRGILVTETKSGGLRLHLWTEEPQSGDRMGALVRGILEHIGAKKFDIFPARSVAPGEQCSCVWMPYSGGNYLMVKKGWIRGPLGQFLSMAHRLTEAEIVALEAATVPKTGGSASVAMLRRLLSGLRQLGEERNNGLVKVAWPWGLAVRDGLVERGEAEAQLLDACDANGYLEKCAREGDEGKVLRTIGRCLDRAAASGDELVAGGATNGDDLAELRAWAQKQMDSMVRAVRDAPEEERADAVFRLAREAGRYAAAGWIDEAGARARIEGAAPGADVAGAWQAGGNMAAPAAPGSRNLRVIDELRITMGGDEPRCNFKVNGKPVSCAMSLLTNQRKFRDLIYTATGIMYSTCREDAWAARVTDWTAAGTVVVADDETTTVGIYRAEITQWIENHSLGRNTRRDLLAGRTWFDRDAQAWVFRLKDLTDYFSSPHRRTASPFTDWSQTRHSDMLKDHFGAVRRPQVKVYGHSSPLSCYQLDPSQVGGIVAEDERPDEPPI